MAMKVRGRSGSVDRVPTYDYAAARNPAGLRLVSGPWGGPVRDPSVPEIWLGRCFGGCRGVPEVCPKFCGRSEVCVPEVVPEVFL